MKNLNVFCGKIKVSGFYGFLSVEMQIANYVA
jgi:hypothetical protein